MWDNDGDHETGWQHNWLRQEKSVKVWMKEWEKKGRAGRRAPPAVLCMGGFHRRRNAVRDSFNSPNSASVPSLLTRPHTHTHTHTPTVVTSTYQSFSLHNAPLPTTRRSLAAFPCQPASSAQASINRNDLMKYFSVATSKSSQYDLCNPPAARSSWNSGKDTEMCLYLLGSCRLLIFPPSCGIELLCPIRSDTQQPAACFKTISIH